MKKKIEVNKNEEIQSFDGAKNKKTSNKEEKIKRGENITSDFQETNKVVQANSLIRQTNWALNKTSLLMFKMAVSCINTSNPSSVVQMTKKDIINFVGFNKTVDYGHLKRELEKLNVFVKVRDDKKKMVKVTLVHKIEWEKEIDIIKIHFHDDVLPYLINLKEYFTQYQIYSLKGFKSKYTMILFENLVLERGLSIDDFKNNKIISFEMTIEELRNVTNTVNEYERIQNLETRVLKVVKKEINEKRNNMFLLDYEKIKVGRRIEGIRFLMRKRDITKEETEF